MNLLPHPEKKKPFFLWPGIILVVVLVGGALIYFLWYRTTPRPKEDIKEDENAKEVEKLPETMEEVIEYNSGPEDAQTVINEEEMDRIINENSGPEQGTTKVYSDEELDAIIKANSGG